MRRTLPLRLLAFFLLIAPGLRADVLIEESYSLVAGWNLIHVPVEPIVKDPLAALSAINWESLWTWLPTESEPRGGRWLVIYRDQPSFLSTLFSLTGPRSYFLFTPSGGTLRIKGAVRSSRQGLRGGAYQLFAPRFDRSSPPTFANYFSRPGVKEHIGQGFELAGQAYRRLASSTPLRPGAAYWLFPDRDIPTPDPVRLGVGVGGLRFDAQTTVSEVVVDVGDGTEGGGGGLESRQLNLRATAVVPPGGQGNTDWLELQGPDGAFVAVSAGATIEVAPAQTSVRVTLRAVRPNTSTSAAADQQAVIELSTPQGQVVVAAELDVPSLQGTWIGEATITEVERPSFFGGGFGPAPELQIALILDIPTVGPARLLPCAKIETARDGRNMSYRLEAALFHEAVSLLGTIASDGKSGAVVGTMALPPEHPLNPYRHRYHPEHRVGFDITRSTRLEFGATLAGGGPLAGAESPFATVGVVTGVYEDEIVGLTQEPIRLRGSFRLRRIAAGSVLPCGVAGQ